MTNQLRHENSPYLLQHVDNPVSWFPWGEEALEKARTAKFTYPAEYWIRGLSLVSRDGT